MKSLKSCPILISRLVAGMLIAFWGLGPVNAKHLLSPSNQTRAETQDLKPNTGIDSRSMAKKMLEAINATLENRAGTNQQQYEINNQRLSQIAIPELIIMRDEFARLVALEERYGRPSKTESSSPKPVESRPELFLQTGHLGTVRTVAFSPNGRFLVSAAANDTAKLWEISTGRELRTFDCSTCPTAFSPDGRYLAMGAGLWEAETGRKISTPFSPIGAITAVTFSPDGRWLVSGSWEGRINVLDTSSEHSYSFSAHTGPITSITIGPDSRWLVSASRDKAIKLWELDTIRNLNSIAADFSISGGGKRIKLWERLDTGRHIRTLVGHADSVNSIALAPDGSWLVSIGLDGSIKVWDIPSGRELRTLAKPSLHTDTIAISPNGRRIVTAGSGNLVKLLDADTGGELFSFAGHTQPVTAVTFSSDGRLLASGSADRTVRLWDADTGNQVRTLAAHIGVAGAVAFSGNGRWLVSGSTAENTLYVWEVGAGLERRRLSGFTGDARTLALSQDGRWLATGDQDKTINLWDLTQETEVRALSGHAKTVSAIAISPDNRLLASGSLDSTVKVWELHTGREVGTLSGHNTDSGANPRSFSSGINAVAFSPDGRFLASSAGRDKTIKLWEVATGQEIRTLVGQVKRPMPGHIVALGGISSLVFSPNGKFLASAGGDRTVTLWDMTTGKEPATLGGGSIDIEKVVFDPNGQFLAALSRYLGTNMVMVWDVSTGRSLATLILETAHISDLAISADGRRILTGSADGTRVWDTGTGQLLATLVSLRDSTDWLVITPDGLFDGSPATRDLILWRFSGNAFDVAPVEIFFNEFYYPGLLAEILANKRPKAPRSISLLDRRQPLVKLELVQPKSDRGLTKGDISSRLITVTISVEEALADKTYQSNSGVRDVRLFRNGSLVKMWRGDVLRGRGSKIALEASIPIVEGENHLTAYAFNRDNIKSADFHLVINGAQSLNRRGKLHIVVVGIDQYSNRNYNLRYAVTDAHAFADELRRQQIKTGAYTSVETIPLLNQEATKANILMALRRLAGREATASHQRIPPVIENITPVLPEDAVVIYFAGHGTAQDRRFYLIPHDLGYSGSRTELNEANLNTILAHSISDQDLEQVFEEMDAERLLLIIDACNSGQALESDDKRQGPMNSKGLAQLAYDKGMYIMTAAQGYQAAMEVAQLGYGLLTYAVVEEGLKTSAADSAPKDGQVMLREWLDYAVVRVPQLQMQKLKEARDLKIKIAFVDGEEKIPAPENRSLQRPRVFYRRELEARPWIIAKP